MSFYDDLMKSSRQLGKHPLPESLVFTAATRKVDTLFLLVDGEDLYFWFVGHSRRLQLVEQLQAHISRVDVWRL